MSTSRDCPVITIDGPGGAGKGTAAKRVATLLGWHILDSGMIYRLLGLASLGKRIDSQDQAGLVELASSMNVRFEAVDGAEGLTARLDEVDVSDDIRSEEAGMMASQVAALGPVRQALLERQRAFAQPPGLVADGRDMGTVVFKNAPLKVFLTASVEARAKRRYQQLLNKGLDGNLARLSEAIEARDRADMTRAVAPLVPADDAVIIDSTEKSIEAVGDEILQLAAERGLRGKAR